MVYKRVWDSSCPRVWDSWESRGRYWVIQDLRPQDDELAADILINHLAADEPLCIQSGVVDDPESAEGARSLWRTYLAERTSLGCYTEVDGRKTLVALNCVKVTCKGEDPDLKIKGKGFNNVFGAMMLMEKKVDAFEYLGADKLLTAMGLVVTREFRGMNLGYRLLNAREPLCRHLGVPGTETIFTAVASQKQAAKCGFTTIVEMTWTDFADAGLDYPRVGNICKMMVKKYE